ncbi:ROK family protein [Paenibacillus albicereus]|uniref:ROK family protein n=1 Tax=Paenibacillus albicereus TaxID=2726185 RepID=A0A6H2H1F5_9BACL|nr:ROK family protein [Paenibacillus albicereus]QJC53521.1 ROK family protein [Paenibacillus albicereus]
MIVHDGRSSLAVGVDVGGTKILAGLISEAGEVLRRMELPTRAGEADPCARIVEAIESLGAEGALPPVRGIGVGTAGQVEWRSGSIRHSSALLPGYTGTPLRQLLEDRFGLPALVDNDVNALAVAELRLGAGRGCRDFICVALGTGVGGAVVSGGRLMRGAWGGAGELGHLSVDRHGPRCICGSRGCLELYASGTGIAAGLKRRLEAAGLPADGADARAAVSGWLAGDDVHAASAVEDALDALGAAAASLAHALNPQRILIGGGVADAGEPFFAALQARFREHAMPSLAAGVELLPAVRGRDSGLIGAALQLWEDGAIGVGSREFS